jgi:hypothetical protein
VVSFSFCFFGGTGVRTQKLVRFTRKGNNRERLAKPAKVFEVKDGLCVDIHKCERFQAVETVSRKAKKHMQKLLISFFFPNA